MKNIIRLLIQNIIYIAIAWLVALLFSNSLLIFSVLFTFLFFIGELIAHLVTASAFEIKKLDAFRYICTILIFIFLFHPTYKYAFKSTILKNADDPEMVSNYIFPPYYAKIDFSYELIMDKNSEAYQTKLQARHCFAPAAVDLKTYKPIKKLYFQWCPKDMEQVNDKFYPKEQWFQVDMLPIKDNKFGEHKLHLYPVELDFNPKQLGNYYSYGFIVGLILVNSLIFFGNNRD